MKIVRNLKTLKQLEELSNGEWKFDREFKYNIGKTYPKTKSLQIGKNYYRKLENIRKEIKTITKRIKRSKSSRIIKWRL